jgi:hypothetical protein
MGRSPYFGLGEGLTVPHHKRLACYKMSHIAWDSNVFFGMTYLAHIGSSGGLL